MRKSAIIYIMRKDVEDYYKFASPQFKDKAVDMLWEEFERRRGWRRAGAKAYKNSTDREILSNILVELMTTKHLFAFMVDKELGLL